MAVYTKGKLEAIGSGKAKFKDAFFIRIEGTRDSFVAKTYGHTGLPAEANAAELVKRWNCHEDLVKVCEGLMKKADNGSADFDDPEPGSIYLKAKAALAAVKES